MRTQPCASLQALQRTENQRRLPELLNNSPCTQPSASTTLSEWCTTPEIQEHQLSHTPYLFGPPRTLLTAIRTIVAPTRPHRVNTPISSSPLCKHCTGASFATPRKPSASDWAVELPPPYLLSSNLGVLKFRWLAVFGSDLIGS